jgi:hypothetical protein
MPNTIVGLLACSIALTFIDPAAACRGPQFESYAITKDAPKQIPKGAVVLEVAVALRDYTEDMRFGKPGKASVVRVIVGPPLGKVIRIQPKVWSSCDRLGYRRGYMMGFLEPATKGLRVIVPVTRRVMDR